MFLSGTVNVVVIVTGSSLSCTKLAVTMPRGCVTLRTGRIRMIFPATWLCRAYTEIHDLTCQPRTRWVLWYSLSVWTHEYAVYRHLIDTINTHEYAVYRHHRLGHCIIYGVYSVYGQTIDSKSVYAVCAIYAVYGALLRGTVPSVVSIDLMQIWRLLISIN